jgi:exo-1,4-beta-D-glucosaminidase
VDVVNSTLAASTGMTATVTVSDIPSLTTVYTNQVTLDVPANASTRAFTVPALSGLSTTYFIRMQLRSSTGQLVSDNLYWCSTTPDALGNKSNWFSTSVSSFANLNGLSSLPSNPGLTATASRTVANGQETVTTTLSNTSATNVAFFVHAEVTAGSDGLEVLPVGYSDNYVSLWPGESTTITATYATSDLGGQAPFLRVSGYNVPKVTLAVP